MELTSSNALDNPYRDAFFWCILLVYINDLARYTQWLPLTFASLSEEENIHIRKLFRSIENHFRDLARMAIFPTRETLDILRDDFF